MKKQLFTSLILTFSLCSCAVLTAQEAARDTTTGSSVIEYVPRTTVMIGDDGSEYGVTQMPPIISPEANSGDADDLGDINIDNLDEKTLEQLQNATAVNSMLPAWMADALQTGAAKILSLPGVTPALFFVLDIPGVLPTVIFLRDNAEPVALTALTVLTILSAKKCLAGRFTAADKNPTPVG